MIVLTGLFTIFSVAVSATQFFISGRNCGVYAVAGSFAAIDVLLGAAISFGHCYDWFTRRVPGFDRGTSK